MASISATQSKVDDIANRRKPRMYASPQQHSLEKPIPLEFCVWLQNNFDEVLELNESMRFCDHKWHPVGMSAYSPMASYLACQCGAFVSERFLIGLRH